ncbi:DNA translocase FtsK 4TM domain-containing protein [Thioclava litoralis]|uniref:DNA translocase FtsK n=1 Tax=Thioclava litoralis TaxID=3076557 RepID=A0ABZ1E1S8_9RHOB|nr:DNA translocase FtsK 4TM domain-containing protein [Thioclava sp. FTW29]
MALYQMRQRDPLLDQNTQALLERRGKELAGAGLIVLAALLSMMLVSYSPEDPSWMAASDGEVQNWLGRIGAGIASPLYVIFGRGSWLLPLASLAWGVRFMTHRGEERALSRLIFLPIAIAVSAVHSALLVPGAEWTANFGLGGHFGDMIAGMMLGIVGASAFVVKFLSLLFAAGSLAMMAFVTGFVKPELQNILRFLLLGLLAGYDAIMRMIGQGASASVLAARGAAERHRARRAEAQAHAAELAEWEAQQDYQAQAAQPSRAQSARRAPVYQAPVYDEEEEVLYDDEPEQDAPRAGFLSRIIRPAEPEPMVEAELVDFEYDDPRAGTDEAPSPERIKARIAEAVHQRRQAPRVQRQEAPQHLAAPVAPEPEEVQPARPEAPLSVMAAVARRLARGPKLRERIEPQLKAEPARVEPPLRAEPRYMPRFGASHAEAPSAPYADMAHPAYAPQPAPRAQSAAEVSDARSRLMAEPHQDFRAQDQWLDQGYHMDEVETMDSHQFEPFDVDAFSALDETYGSAHSEPAPAQMPRASFSAPVEENEEPSAAYRMIQRGEAYAEDATLSGDDDDDMMDAPQPSLSQPSLDEAHDMGVARNAMPDVPAVKPVATAKTVAQGESLNRGPIQKPVHMPSATHANYEAPPMSLLTDPASIPRHQLPDEALEENARQLETVLEDYGVKGEIVSVRPGPVVTMYELEPAPGLKASRVIGLADDIARSMSALSARVSTVPGRTVIGIELPNEHREKVVLREILSARDFSDGNMRLPLALGKDIGGEPVVANLAKMPHLLIAGTTGSGKSVAINTMILSLLYRLTPDECRLIMIDPKMLELSVYDGIPHLLSPVVTDPKKAVVALKWVVGEMEDRYRKMSKMGVRNIEGYNGRVKETLARGEMFKRTVQTGFDEETGEPIFETDEFRPEPFPYIVVIVDEMADLMMVAGKEIEACIQRLAQMARASGIHLIMATQRPSVDVITGTIKANFPTRISFQVTSKIDSRTILGEQGAEQLLGMGDMLYMGTGSRLNRVHGPFCSDEEVEEVVNHLKSFGPPSYMSGVVEGPEDDKASDIDAVLGLNTGGNTGNEDALYDQAVQIVAKDRKCSTSYIQRKLGIGYNKAARLVEQMEENHVVSSANHVGKREILIPEA